MRVLINTYPAAFITPGGGEIQLMKTYEHLLRQGVDVVLYSQWAPQLDQVDLVHFFSVFGGSLYFCQKVKERGLKLIVSPILWLDQPEKYPLGEIKAILDLADLILPNSQKEANLLSRVLELNPAKFHIAYNAADVGDKDQIDADSFRRQYGLGEYLLCVGNIEERKNQYRLVQALRDFDMPLVCIGHVRDRDYFDQCQIAGGSRFRYIEALPHNSPLLLSAYAGAKMFVLASTLETPGLAALEAAAAGCPKIVVTGIGSAPEYFGDCAEYIDDPYDVENIRRVIALLLEAKDRDCSNQVRQFSWERTAEQTLAAYQKALGEIIA